MSLSTPSTASVRNTRLSLQQGVIKTPPTLAGNDGATPAEMGIKNCEGGATKNEETKGAANF